MVIAGSSKMIDETFAGYKILPSDIIEKDSDYYNNLSACALIHLYYIDTIDYYFQYITKIPDNITKIFTYSNKKSKKEIEKRISFYSIVNYKLIRKDNRGRDISAFLVAAKDEVQRYDLVCFLHDKKSHYVIYEQDTNEWIQLLWENLVGGIYYIENIINAFEEDDKLGVLFPPSLASKNGKHDLSYKWEKNYNNTKKLAETIGLTCKIKEENVPGTPGTMFWARTAALKKLLDYPWTYESFDPEPLANDGTISHAVERIIRFVSMDAGYKEYIVLSDRSAEKYLAQVQSDAREEYKILNDKLSIHYHDIEYYESWADRLLSFVADFSEIYIYGARIYGIQCLKILRDAGYSVSNFVVSSKEGNPDKVSGIPVISIDELQMSKKSCLIIGMDHMYYDEIRETLKKADTGIPLQENKNVLYYQICD